MLHYNHSWNFVTAVELKKNCNHAPTRRWKSLTISVFISIQYRCVTDGRTDRYAITISHSAWICEIRQQISRVQFYIGYSVITHYNYIFSINNVVLLINTVHNVWTSCNNKYIILYDFLTHDCLSPADGHECQRSAKLQGQWLWCVC